MHNLWYGARMNDDNNRRESFDNECHDNRRERVARWHSFVSDCLGRDPRGLRDVVAFNSEGKPTVIQVSSVVGDKPFPTLYWLIDAALSLRIDRLEAAGWIARLQTEINHSECFRRRMQTDHTAHIALRDSFITAEERALLGDRGMLSALSQRGIGGISEPDRVRCLHTWYAAHLVVPNGIGDIVDSLFIDASPRPMIAALRL